MLFYSSKNYRKFLLSFPFLFFLIGHKTKKKTNQKNKTVLMYSKHNLGCTHTERSIGLIADVDTNVVYLT